MPDHSGMLSKHEIDKIIGRLKNFDSERGRPLSCSVCAHERWIVEPQLLGMQPTSLFGIQTTSLYSRAFIMLKCTNCGHSLFFDSDAFGVVQSIDTRIEAPPVNVFAQFGQSGAKLEPDDE